MRPIFCVFVYFLSVIYFASPVRAQTDWQISSFDSHLNIQSSGLLGVVENIEADFRLEEKHGIFRNIPYVYLNSDGSKTYLEFQVNSVKRNGNTEPYSLDTTENELVIKIGDPDETISGHQIYQLDYTVKGGLVGYEGFDELYWNVTGNYWPVPIEKASAAVSLPSGEILQQSCFQGLTGSTETCTFSKLSPTSTLFATTRELNHSEGLTIAVGYTKNLVPLLKGEAPKTVADDLFKPLNLGVTVAMFFIGIFLIYYLWLRKGRDFWFGRNYLFGNKIQITPVGAKENIVVEYSSPENLRPAELAMLIDERADTLDVTATLVDLANRGYLTITEEPKKWAFGSKDYIFNKLTKDRKALLEFEQELLQRLFDDGELVKMSALKNKFYKDLAVVKEKLYQNLLNKNFFTENPNKVRGKYALWAVLLGLLAGGLIWLGLSLINSLVVELGIVGLILSIILLIVAQFMPARTALGRQLYARAKGYRLFIDTAEKHRQRFFEKKNLFNEVLPYAIVFGLTENFAKAFEKMGIEPEKPSWYYGTGAFRVAAFGSAMNSFSSSVSSSIASSPGSSGSGGGGSSGGGFGGGGGGSW